MYLIKWLVGSYKSINDSSLTNKKRALTTQAFVCDQMKLLADWVPMRMRELWQKYSNHTSWNALTKYLNSDYC